MSDIIPIEAVGREIKARVEAGDKALDKAEQHFLAAGIQLLEAKERVRGMPGLTWPAFLNSYWGIRRRRADELIMIADGRTTLAELREQKAESVRASRTRKKEESALRSAQSLTLAADTSAASASPDELAALMSAWNAAGQDTRREFMQQACLVPKDWFEDAAVSRMIERGDPIPGALAESRWGILGLEPPAEAPTPDTSSERRPYHYEVDKKTGKYTKVDDPDLEHNFVKAVLEKYTNGTVDDDGRLVRKPDSDDTLTEDQIPAFLKKDAA